MKKRIFWALSMTALMLSVSCSKEFDVCSTVTGQPVTISASIPELDTKSVPSAPEGHVLRCILVVDHPTVADSRYEAVADGTNNFSFTFTPQESGYRCLLWADYIDASASAVDGRYADKYYDTDDLRAVGYVETVLTDGSLFNNEACDAFSGVLAEGKTQVTLLRPFARLTFKNKDANTPVDAVALSISYNVYTKYDVAGRTVATSDNTETISASGIAPADAAAGVWFFNYVFAPDDRQYLDTGNITLTKDSDEPKTIATAECDDSRMYQQTSEANLAYARSVLEEAEIAAADATLVSPEDGIVLIRILEPGTMIKAGVPVYTISLNKNMWVRVYLKETDLGRVSIGMPVQIMTDSSDKIYHGHIGFISPQAEFTPKNIETASLRTDLVYRTRIIIDNPDDALKQGMPVTVSVKTND